MITKKLVHFEDYNKYLQYKKANNLLDSSIIFIANDESIETHDTLYKMVSWAKLIPTIQSYSDWEIVNLETWPVEIEPCETTITIAGLAQRTVYWSDENTSTETAIPRFIASYGTLVDNKLTIPANTNSTQKTITITATYEGASKSINVIQKGDYISSYGDITITTNSVSDIPAKGGTVSTSGSKATQSVTYKSGVTGTIALTVTEKSISASSRGITPGDRILVDTIKLSVSNGGKSASKSVSVYQQANVKTLSSIYIVPYQPDSSWVVTVTNNNWNTCPASGGYVKCHGYYSYSFTSGEYNDEHITTNASLTWSTGYGDWINDHVNGGYYISNRGTSTGDARSATATWTSGGKTSAAKTLTQQANTWWDGRIAAVWSANGSTSYTVGPAGGTAYITIYCYRHYTSGAEGSAINVTGSSACGASGAASGFTVNNGSGTDSVSYSYNNVVALRSLTVTCTYAGLTAPAIVISQKGTNEFSHYGEFESPDLYLQGYNTKVNVNVSVHVHFGFTCRRPVYWTFGNVTYEYKQPDSTTVSFNTSNVTYTQPVFTSIHEDGYCSYTYEYRFTATGQYYRTFTITCWEKTLTVSSLITVS